MSLLSPWGGGSATSESVTFQMPLSLTTRRTHEQRADERQLAHRRSLPIGRRRPMKRFGIGLLCAIAGYIAAAVSSYFLIDWLSSNTHDRSIEAAMTSA